MNLAKSGGYYEPFDTVYDLVTESITNYGNALNHAPSKNWLFELRDKFISERKTWPTDVPTVQPFKYQTYFDECARLNKNVLRLAACAFFHISYDLPRVIANNWPGTGRWQSAPSENIAEDLFFGLTPIFPSAFQHLATNSKVMGAPSLFLRAVPDTALMATGHWALHLRTAAWIHARRLANDSNRSLREKAMLAAMIASLRRVSNKWPWTAGVLGPPHVAVLPLGQVTITPWLTATKVSIGTTLISLAAVLFLVREWQKRKRESELLKFVNEFGMLVLFEMERAVSNPVSYLSSFEKTDWKRSKYPK